jgi:AcrR family transcriptional regulator
MLAAMGRPREHDQRTAAALLAAAERTVEEGGLDALSVRGVALDVGVSTRAVYSVFGSKDGLIVALGARAFDLLGTAVREIPVTDDPSGDLVGAGLAFRRFAIEHPSLFTIGIQRALPSAELWSHFRGAAETALSALESRVARLEVAGRLGGRTIADATLQFHALCEGLASLEQRAPEPRPDTMQLWREALGALVNGFAVSPAG